MITESMYFINYYKVSADQWLNSFAVFGSIVGAGSLVQRSRGTLTSTITKSNVEGNLIDPKDIVCTRRSVGPPQGTFVLPKSVDDELISKSGGDVLKIEELLGLVWISR